jgi:hypothetical protein
MITATDLLEDLQAAHREHRRATRQGRTGRAGLTSYISDTHPWIARRVLEEHRARLLTASYDTTCMCMLPEHADPGRHRYEIATTPRD